MRQFKLIVFICLFGLSLALDVRNLQAAPTVIKSSDFTPLVNIGIEPNSGVSGIYIGIKDILASGGITNNLKGYVLEVTFDPAQIIIQDAVNVVSFGMFEQHINNSTATFTDSSASIESDYSKLFFLPVKLVGKADTLVSLRVHLVKVTDENFQDLNTDSEQVIKLQRGKVLNEENTTIGIDDAVAGLQFLAKLRDTGLESGSVNTINMSSIMPGESGAIHQPSVKDVICLMQYLAGDRNDLFELKNTSQQEEPTAPTIVSATALSQDQISISWQSVDGATGYNIYRFASSSGEFAKLNTTPLDITVFLDMTVTAGNTYYYKVTAINDIAESKASVITSRTAKLNDLILNGGETLIDCADAANFTYRSPNTVTPVLDVTPVIEGVTWPVIKSQNTTAGTNQSYEFGVDLLSSPKNLANLDSIEVRYWIYDITTINSIRFDLKTSDGNFFSHYFSRLSSGENVIRFRLKDMIVTGSPDIKNVTQTKFQVYANLNSIAPIGINSLKFNIIAKPKVLITWDDAWQSTYDNAYPILASKGFSATTWAISDFVKGTNPEYMRASTLTTLYNAGWDIGNHSKDHYLNPSTMTYQEMYDNYKTCQDYLEANGWFRGARNVCYPSGYYNYTLIQALKDMGVKTGRTAPVTSSIVPGGRMLGGYVATPVLDLFKLKVSTLSSRSTLETVKADIDAAIETGQTIIFMAHGCKENPTQGIDVSTAVLQQVVDYLYEHQVDVVTISDWYDSLNIPDTVVDKTALTTAITSSSALLGSKTIGMAVGNVTKAEHDAYNSAISSATAINNNPNVIQVMVNVAVSALSAATTAFNNAIITDSGIALLDCTTLTPWTYKVGANLSLDTSVTFQDIPALKCESTSAGNITAFGIPAAMDLTGLDTIELILYFYGANPIDTLQSLRFTLWTSMGNYFYYYVPSSYFSNVNGVAKIRFSLADCARLGNPEINKINRIDLNIENKPSMLSSIGIFSANCNAKELTKALFTFDDGKPNMTMQNQSLIRQPLINVLKSLGVKTARTTHIGLKPRSIIDMYQLKQITLG